MPIAVACACGAKFAAKDELAGKKVKCPKCAQPLTIPGAGAAAPAGGQTKSAATRSGEGGDPIIAALLDEVGLTASKTGIRCPNCRADMQPESVLCVKCGFNTETGKKLKTRVDEKKPGGGH